MPTVAAGAHRVGVAVSGIEVGALLPIVDATGGDPEERGPTQIDEELLGLGELGVAPFPVT